MTQRLTPNDGEGTRERLERAARVLELAEQVLGSHEAAIAWLRKPLPRLGGVAPIAHLEAEAGARAVEEILLQAEYGFTA